MLTRTIIDPINKDKQPALPLDIQVSFSDEELIDVDKGFLVANLKNFIIKNPSANTKKKLVLSNKYYYLIDAEAIQSHYHFMLNIFLPFVTLRKYYNTLTPIILRRNIEKNPSTVPELDAFSQMIFGAIDKYFPGQTNVVHVDEFSEIHLRSIMVTDRFFNAYLSRSSVSIKSSFYGIPIPYLSSAGRSVFRSRIRMPVSGKKIFLSRAKENLNNLFAYETLKKANDKSIVLSQTELEILRHMSRSSDNIQRITFRTLPAEEMEMVESFFESMGFKICDMSSMSLEHQISEITSAEHIAGFAGAAFINTIFCGKGQTVSLLHRSDGYLFNHERIPMFAGCQTFNIPDISRKGPTLKINTAEEIIMAYRETFSIDYLGNLSTLREPLSP